MCVWELVLVLVVWCFRCFSFFHPLHFLPWLLYPSPLISLFFCLFYPLLFFVFFFSCPFFLSLFHIFFPALLSFFLSFFFILSLVLLSSFFFSFFFHQKFCLHSSSLSCRPLPPSFVPVGALNNQASSTHHPASSISSPSTNKPPLKSPILVPYPPPTTAV
ncbi:hypothetical protein EDB81DRAFT_830622, partial [Dactylonectria macrodidyma]